MTSLGSLRRGIQVTLLTFTALAVPSALPSWAAETNVDAGWHMYNGTYTGERYSAAKQITPGNVGSLKEVGRFTLPETTSFQSGPVIVGDTLFVTTATSTYAINASTGKSVWTHKYEPRSMGLEPGFEAPRTPRAACIAARQTHTSLHSMRKPAS